MKEKFYPDSEGALFTNREKELKTLDFYFLFASVITEAYLSQLWLNSKPFIRDNQ